MTHAEFHNRAGKAKLETLFCDNCEAPSLGFYCEECDMARLEGFLELPEPPPKVACPYCDRTFYLPLHGCAGA